MSERRRNHGRGQRCTVQKAVPIAAEVLHNRSARLSLRGGIVEKTARKVATDEHMWNTFVEEQGIEVGANQGACRGLSSPFG